MRYAFWRVPHTQRPLEAREPAPFTLKTRRLWGKVSIEVRWVKSRKSASCSGKLTRNPTLTKTLGVCHGKALHSVSLSLPSARAAPSPEPPFPADGQNCRIPPQTKAVRALKPGANASAGQGGSNALCWAQRRPNALENLPFFTSHHQIFTAAPRVVAVLVFSEYGRNKSSPKIVRRRVATGEHTGGRRVNFTPLRATWRP